MADVVTAEHLWASAHEHLRQGALERAVQDLARCFEILQAHGDARAYAVRGLWVDVQRRYLESATQAAQGVLAAHDERPPSLEAQVVPDLGPASAPASAPAMAVEDAPVGMQSLDVPFSVGDTIDSWQAEELPVRPDPSSSWGALGAASDTDPDVLPAHVRADVAFLEELLVRVQERRRPAAPDA